MEPIETTNDQDLLKRASKGDSDAFGQIYDKHHLGVWRFVLRETGSPLLAEDVVHDTFVELYKSPLRFDPARGAQLGTYLCGIAKNIILKQYRRANWEVLDANTKNSFPNQRTVPSFETSKIIGMDVQKALSALTEQQREVVILKEMEDYSTNEIVGMVGTSVQAVKARLHRAREGLRKLLSSNPRLGGKP